MGSLAEIRTGAETRLATITGLNAHDEEPGTIITPAAFPMPGSIEYDETMDSDVSTYTLRIRLLVQLAVNAVAQSNLDPYLAPSGSSSIRAAFNGDHTLGGAAHWSRLSRCARYGVIEHAGQPYLGADFDLEVNAGDA